MRVRIEGVRVEIWCVRVKIACVRVKIACVRVKIECARVKIECARVKIECAHVKIYGVSVKIECARVKIGGARVKIGSARVKIECASVKIEGARVKLYGVSVKTPCARVKIWCARAILGGARVKLQGAHVNIGGATRARSTAKWRSPRLSDDFVGDGSQLGGGRSVGRMQRDDRLGRERRTADRAHVDVARPSAREHGAHGGRVAVVQRSSHRIKRRVSRLSTVVARSTPPVCRFVLATSQPVKADCACQRGTRQTDGQGSECGPSASGEQVPTVEGHGSRGRANDIRDDAAPCAKVTLKRRFNMRIGHVVDCVRSSLRTTAEGNAIEASRDIIPPAMNQDLLMESLWSDVVNPSSASAPLLAACLPATGDVAEAASRVVATGADVVHVHRLLRDARSAAIFHAFVALEESEGELGFDHLAAAQHVESLGAIVAFRRRRPSPTASVADMLSALGAALPPEMSAMFDAQMQLASTAGDPVGDAIDHVVERGVDLADLDVLRAATGRFAVRGLCDRLPSLIDPLEGPHETWNDAPGSGPWPSVPRASVEGPLLVLESGFEIAFASDAEWVVDTRGCVHELSSGRLLARCLVFANTSSIDVSRDGRWLAATSTSGRVAVCDLVTGARVAALSVGGEGEGAQFSPDDAALVASPWRGETVAWRVGTWDAIEPAAVAEWPPLPTIDVSAWPAAIGARRPMTWSPDRKWIAWTTFDAVELRDAQGALCGRRKLPNPTGARFSADGRRVALGAWKDGEVWDVARLVALHGV